MSYTLMVSPDLYAPLVLRVLTNRTQNPRNRGTGTPTRRTCLSWTMPSQDNRSPRHWTWPRLFQRPVENSLGYSSLQGEEANHSSCFEPDSRTSKLHHFTCGLGPASCTRKNSLSSVSHRTRRLARLLYIFDQRIRSDIQVIAPHFSAYVLRHLGCRVEKACMDPLISYRP